MRILSLEIRNIRGIKNIQLGPNGQTVVVYGPNGTGKSAIADAIDFLLTGKISRLTGEGSKVLDLKEHGCHVDSRGDLKNTIVIAKMQIGANEVTLERSLEKPTTLKVIPKAMAGHVESCLAVTELGQHILTRREILAYITAEAGKRAKKIMSLLNLDIIENTRGSLVTIKNEADSEYADAVANFGVSKTNILMLLSLTNFSDETIISRVNELRHKLDGKPITKLSVETFKAELEPIPFRQLSGFISADEIGSTVKGIRSLYTDKDNLAAKEAELKALLEEFKKDKALAKCVTYEALIKAGINLVDESNVCPLCGRLYEGDFRAFLTEKAKETEVARDKQAKIQEASLFLIQRISLAKNYIQTCVKGHAQFSLKTIDSVELNGLDAEISSWQKILSNPIEYIENDKWGSSPTQTIFSASFIEPKVLVPLDEALSQISPNLSIQQLSWDTLTKMEDRWKTHLENTERKNKAEVFKQRASIVLEKFEESRNSVWNQFMMPYKKISKLNIRQFMERMKRILRLSFRGLAPS